MPNVTLESETVAEALLELLVLRGVEYFIAGGTGTDFPYIVEAYAKREAQGKPVPKPIIGVHEICAVAMAHGYSMVAGKALFTMLHTIVGTANGICGVINAARARAPLFLAAGRTAMTERGDPSSRFHVVQWAQEAFDQAGMLREFTNWTYELHNADQLEVAIDRGFAMAQRAPAGPIYLTLPVELGGESIKDLQVNEEPSQKKPTPYVPAFPELQKAIDALLAAENPVVITQALGRNPKAVPELVKFAEFLSIPVIEFFHTHMNFPQNHPLHMGYDSVEYVRNSDVIVVIECDAPWIPSKVNPRDDATVIVLDEDTLYSRYPYRGFPNEISLTGDAGETLKVINGELANAQLSTLSLSARLDKYAKLHQQQREAWLRQAVASSKTTPMDPMWISKCVVDQIDPVEDIVITEFILDPTQTSFTEPGSYFDHSHAGGLGWSCGAALGAKLAAPEKTVICCIGDGTYTFGVPVATHHMSAMHELPVLFVIFNNAAWDRTRRASRAVSPQGFVANAADVPLCELDPAPAYEMVCQAAGGYGERVDDPEELPAALQRALQVVKEEGRQALLNVICSKV